VEVKLADWFRMKDLEAMAANKQSINEEWVTFPDNGQRVLLETIKTPMRDAEDKLIGVMGIARDITERKQAETRESRLRRILDKTRDMIFMFHPDTLRFVYVNKGAIDSIGYSSEELLLLTPADITPPLPEPELRKLIVPLVSGEKELLRFETAHKCKNGADLPVEVQLQLVQEQEGESVFVAIVRDISERMRAEIELRRQKSFMWQVIDSDPSQIFVKDIRGKYLLVNQSTAIAHGLTPQEMVGRSHAEINRASGEVGDYLADDRKVIEEGDEVSKVALYTLPSGERRWFLVIKKRLTMPDGKFSVLGIALDINQQKLFELQLAESYKELQRLTLHLENIRAEERAKIALNLHDEMGATLAALKMKVSWLASKLPAELPLLSAEAVQINELIADGIHTMHHIVDQLRPDMLGDVEFTEAIKVYVQKFLAHTDIECILVLPKEEFVLNAEQSLTIFRILQEALNNVVKHAQASRVDIHLTARGKTLVMEIRDNGIGFDPTMHKQHSLGLLGIRERALMVGGRAKVSSMRGKGACVSVSIPPPPPRLKYLDAPDALPNAVTTTIILSTRS
jgi:PAS domain S-box-containing protein